MNNQKMSEKILKSIGLLTVYFKKKRVIPN